MKAIPTHYVLPRGPNSMVKEAEFFCEQGGLIAEWGKAWKPVRAESIEDAREQAEKMKHD